MSPRKIFSLLRERAITALVILALFAVVPLGIPGLRSEVISILTSGAQCLTLQGIRETVRVPDRLRAAVHTRKP